MKRLILIIAFALSASSLALAAPEGDAHGAAADHPVVENVELAAEEAMPDMEHGEVEHGEHRKLMTFVVEEAIWTIVVFLLFTGVLAYFVWPKVLGALKEREAKQRTDLETAAKAATEAQDALAQHKAELAGAQKQAQQIIDQSRTEAQRLAVEVREKAQADTEQMRQRAATEIDAAKEQAIASLYEHAAEVSTAVAGKILSREITAEDQSQLIQQSLEEMRQARQN